MKIVSLLPSATEIVYALGQKFRVQPVPDFYAEVRALLGESALA